MKRVDPDPLFANFERDGEKQVRTNIATSKYNAPKRELALQWLALKDQERADAFTREQIDIARDAADSARDAATSARDAASSARTQADEARRANKIAKAAIAIAIIGVAISIMGFLRDQSAPESAPSPPQSPAAPNP